MLAIIFAFLALASSLVWYLLRHDHGRHLPAGSLWTAFGFGVLAMGLALVVEGLLFPNALFDSPASFSLHYRFFAALGVGFVEESLKFVPFALFIYKRPYFREHTDGVIYFAICGLTFGLTENIGYTLSFGAGAGVARLILTPFFHAAGTGILGYYLIGEKLNRSSWPILLLACLTIPVLHGLYDFGLLSSIPIFVLVSLMVTLLLTMGLFLYFMSANELDRANLAREAAAPLSLSHVAGRPVYASTPPVPQLPLVDVPATPGQRNGLAIAGFVLGVLGCLAWLLSLVGTIIGVLALVFGIKGLHSRHRGLAITSIVLSLLVIPLSLFMTLAYIGYYEGASTKSPTSGPSSALFSEPIQPATLLRCAATIGSVTSN
jgi:RsiW-degrading membrane proteinase PrsW (M82 family)